MKSALKIVAVCLTVFLASCEQEPTLQEYYVDAQEKSGIITFDIPTSLMTGENSNLDPEQKRILETINKVNVLAIPSNEGSFTAEKERVSSILNDERYNLLMKVNDNGKQFKVMYLGEDDAIDEIVAFGVDQDRGFGLARIIGDQMNPEEIMKLASSMKDGDLNVSGVQEFLKGIDTSGFERKD
ncbi:hypothetical protein GCM10009117_10810 [Gangjinia marincola]|uniref:DUF4252 domain-containing protein n=1 Tax=Gangjinia marincola TaxID=578463 RepID=A0ABN1MGD9_9FLAO